jgi:thiamine biosynthesis lipoprotein ApbE
MDTNKMRHGTWVIGTAAAIGASWSAHRAPAAMVEPPAVGAVPGAAALEQFNFGHESVLGTSLDLIVRAQTSVDAVECQRQVLAEIERLRQILSTYDPSSIIRQYMAGERAAAPELDELLAAYEVWSVRTGGAVNARLGAVIELWKQAGQAGRLPGAEALQQAVNQPLALNVDALGKGYIIDRAVAVAQRFAPAGLLNIGGDMRAWGDVSWTIGVADPRNPADNAPWLTSFGLRDAAVATSGDYARYQLIAGRRYSHIIDPRTLQPVQQVTSATVVAAAALDANALATAGSILGAEDGLRLAQAYGAHGQLFVGAGGAARAAGAVPAPQKLQTKPSQQAESAQAWPAGYEVSIGVALKDLAQPSPGQQPGGRRGGRGGYRRPYVAVWVQDDSGKTVRTISVWGSQPRWVPELSYWWKAIGGDESAVRATTRATRPPGKYNITWDGKDDAGNALPRGSYTITLEINREHGRHVKESATIDCAATPTTAALKATAESDESTVTFGPRAGE